MIAYDGPALAELLGQSLRDPRWQFWAGVVTLLVVVVLLAMLWALVGQVLADRAAPDYRIPRGLPLTIPALGSTVYYRLVESAYIEWRELVDPNAPRGHRRTGVWQGRDIMGREWLVQFSRARDGWILEVVGKVPSLYPRSWERQPTRRRAQDAVLALLMQE